MAQTQWSDLRMLASSVSITPTTPQCLGAGDLKAPVDQVRSGLEANLIHLESSDARVLFVSLDLLYPGRTIRAALERELSEFYRPVEIFLAASHTHNAPAVDVDKQTLGEVDYDYLETVIRTLVTTVYQMRRSAAEPIRAVVKSGYVNSAVNRRLPRFVRASKSSLQIRQVGAGPNPLGPRNETVSVITLEALSGMKATLWNYACHPNSAPLPSSVDAHFPGHIRGQMREASGESQLPVVFLQGFSGDVRPPSLRQDSGLKASIRKLRLGPTFSNFTPNGYASWLTSLAEEVLGVWSSAGEELDASLRVVRCSLPLTKFVKGGADGAQVDFHAVEFGSIVIVGVSGEVVTEYSQRLQSHFPTQRTIGVGCIDNTFGYVPTRDMLGTGGYEDTAFCTNFGLTEVAETVESAMMEGFGNLATALRALNPYK